MRRKHVLRLGSEAFRIKHSQKNCVLVNNRYAKALQYGRVMLELSAARLRQVGEKAEAMHQSQAQSACEFRSD